MRDPWFPGTHSDGYYDMVSKSLELPDTELAKLAEKQPRKS